MNLLQHEIIAAESFLNTLGIDTERKSSTQISVNKDAIIKIIKQKNILLDEDDCCGEVLKMLKRHFNKNFYFYCIDEDDRNFLLDVNN